MTAHTSSRRVSDWATLALAIVITVLGVILFAMGGYLAFLGGSVYYVIYGFVLAAAGILMAMGRVLGAYLYFLAWAGTILWTIYEVGFSWWGWLPRDFGPTILALLVVLSLPVLRRQDTVRNTSRGAV